MPLPALTHRMIAPQAVAATPDMLDLFAAIKQAFGQATYYNGVARTGTPTAWIIEHEETDGGDTVALLLKPASADVADMRVVLAGVVATDSEAPKMIASDAYAAGILMIGVIKKVPEGFNPATDWAGWDDATSPITGTHFTGYARAVAISDVPEAIRVIETQETVWFEVVPEDQDCQVFCGGALLDPFNDAAGEPANGRLYGLFSVGTATSVNWAFWSGAATVGGFLQYSVTSGQAKSAFFAPGDTATISNPALNQFNANAATTTSLTAAGGAVRERLPVSFREGAGGTTNYAGRLRQGWAVGGLPSGTIIKVDGNDVAYAIGHSADTVGNVVALGA